MSERQYDEGFNIKPTEFEVQAELYNHLKKIFDNVKGEVQYFQNDKKGARFDIVVFKNNLDPLFIVEVKETKLNWKPLRYKQIRRYKKLVDCPVYLVRGKREIYSFLDKISKKYI